MKRKNIVLVLSVVSAFVLAFSGPNLSAQAPKAKEPEELDRLRQGYEQKRVEVLKPVTATYAAQLEVLLKKLTQNGNLDGALFVRHELDSVRGSSMQEGQGDLKKALLATKWTWSGGDRVVNMTFKEDGSVSHIGMRGKWEITGLREVTITEENGHKHIFRFDSNLKSYNEFNGGLRGKPVQ